MLKKWIERYRGFSLIKKIGITFILNWILWFSLAYFVKRRMDVEDNGFWYYVAYAIWMSAAFTASLNWSGIRFKFKNRRTRIEADKHESQSW